MHYVRLNVSLKNLFSFLLRPARLKRSRDTCFVDVAGVPSRYNAYASNESVSPRHQRLLRLPTSLPPSRSLPLSLSLSRVARNATERRVSSSRVAHSARRVLA